MSKKGRSSQPYGKGDDAQEERRERFYSTTHTKKPRSKKERYKLAAMLKRFR